MWQPKSPRLRGRSTKNNPKQNKQTENQKQTKETNLQAQQQNLFLSTPVTDCYERHLFTSSFQV